MDRELRELSERIRFIEGFDVVITRKEHRAQGEIGNYGFHRAASRKWSIDYWEEKRNEHPFLQFNVYEPDGNLLSRTTPLETPREAYKRLDIYKGDILRLLWKCNSEAHAMQMRRELLTHGIDAQYKKYNFLWVSWHELEWHTPSLRMTFVEFEQFYGFIKNISQKLSCRFETEYKTDHSSEYLDECPAGYKYISSAEELLNR